MTRPSPIPPYSKTKVIANLGSLLACPGISPCRSGVCTIIQAAYVHFLLWAAVCDTLPPLSVGLDQTEADAASGPAGAAVGSAWVGNP